MQEGRPDVGALFAGLSQRPPGVTMAARAWEPGLLDWGFDQNIYYIRRDAPV